MSYIDEISSRIRLVVRELAGDNNSELERMIGVDEARIRTYTRKNKKPSMPSAEFIAILVRELGISYEWILQGKGDMIEKKPEYVSTLCEPHGEYEKSGFLEKTIYLQQEYINKLQNKIDDRDERIEELLSQQKKSTAGSA